MSDFHGVLPALITPFSEDGSEVDSDAVVGAAVVVPDDDEADDEPHAAVSAATSTTAAFLMAAEPRPPGSRFGYWCRERSRARTRPACIRTSSFSCGLAAGPRRGSPSSRSNADPCQGQTRQVEPRTCSIVPS